MSFSELRLYSVYVNKYLLVRLLVRGVTHGKDMEISPRVVLKLPISDSRISALQNLLELRGGHRSSEGFD
jgi:hypothetical protein